VVALAAALMIVAGPVSAEEETGAAGRGLFVTHCARCHGIDGGGGEGPPLTLAKLRQAPDLDSLVEVILSGIPRTGMPATRAIGDQGAVELAHYVRTLGSIEEVELPGDPARGQEIYREQKCDSCHIVSGEGRGIGPELSEIGLQRGAAHLREELLQPEARVPDTYRVMTVVDAEGKSVRGLRVREDDFHLVLRDADNRLLSYDKSSLRSARRRMGVSVMPSYERRLDEGQVEHLVAYLASLRGDDR
jgi:putative heme-binding domain-containing protein